MKIGFLGLGSMATSIVRGVLKAGFARPQDIFATGRDGEKLARLCAALRINACGSNEALVDAVDVLVLSVKPDAFGAVLPPLAGQLAAKRPLVISVAAGISLETIARLLEDDTLPVARVIPGISAEIGQSMSGICCNAAVSGEQARYVLALFDTLGKSMVIEESLFGIFSAVGCASPAFVFMFIESLARGGLAGGMSMPDALQAAAQAVMGSAQLVLESGEHPSALVDRVTSPGGTTIAGVAALEAGAFRATVMNAVAAVAARDAELAEAGGA